MVLTVTKIGKGIFFLPLKQKKNIVVVVQNNSYYIGFDDGTEVNITAMSVP